MGNILIVAIVFIGFSMSMSWVVGHKERSDLSEKLEATEVTKQDVAEELAKVEKDLKKESSKIKELTEALQKEKEEKARLEEELLQREALLKAAEKEREARGATAQTDGEEGAEASVDEAKKRAEEARKEAESILLQTELDRVMAEELLLKKAEELAVVKAGLHLLQSIRRDDRDEYEKLKQMIEAGKADHAAKMRVRAEEALDAQIAAMKKREATLTVEVKDAALAKEEIEYRLEKEMLLKLERDGEISATELEAALDRASLKHIRPFSAEGIFGYATPGDGEGGQEWWRKDVVDYRVKIDETLSTIAAKDSVYGSEELWPVLYIYNLDKADDPDFMEPGQLLFIPQIITREEVREKIRDYYSREDSEEEPAGESNGQEPEESPSLIQSET